MFSLRPSHYNPLTFTFRNWIFGILFCRLSSFMTHLSIVASVLTMAAIAMERYFPLLVFQYPILGEINRKIILKCLVSKVWQISFRKYLSKVAKHIPKPNRGQVYFYPMGEFSRVTLSIHLNRARNLSKNLFQYE